ncbi:hypothetical protein QAD02_004766 [Eretmocerus hayati]|uniref:Uncharacterized protein n=1 Tax=Eretmocerus hayati TaxID=131215 RepID=A0ACC2NT76_9HYME|nr:hypothetical protein QAD02_004766 [Eretmocerus hayati]
MRYSGNITYSGSTAIDWKPDQVVITGYGQTCHSVQWFEISNRSYNLMSRYIVSFGILSPEQLILKQTVRENGKMEVLYHVGTHSGDTRGLLYRLNFWLISVLIKLLPCLILTIISCRLIQALYKAKARRLLFRAPATSVYLHQPQEPQSDANLQAQNPIGSPDHLQRNRSTGQQDAISRSERRADRTTRMLLAVLLLFLTTEIPQGILGLLSAVLDRCFFRSCYHNLGEIMDILALFNGSVNFVLYCSMSRQFRTTFGALFKPKLTFWNNVTNVEGERDRGMQQLEEQQQNQIQSFDVQTTFV